MSADRSRTAAATIDSAALQRRHDQQSHHAAVLLRHRQHARKQEALRLGRRLRVRVVFFGVDAGEARGHDDDVAGRVFAEDGGEMREHVRIAHGDEDVAR